MVCVGVFLVLLLGFFSVVFECVFGRRVVVVVVGFVLVWFFFGGCFVGVMFWLVWLCRVVVSWVFGSGVVACVWCVRVLGFG